MFFSTSSSPIFFLLTSSLFNTSKILLPFQPKFHQFLRLHPHAPENINSLISTRLSDSTKRKISFTSSSVFFVVRNNSQLYSIDHFNLGKNGMSSSMTLTVIVPCLPVLLKLKGDSLHAGIFPCPA